LNEPLEKYFTGHAIVDLNANTLQVAYPKRLASANGNLSVRTPVSTVVLTMADSGTGIKELMAAETRASQIVAEARIGT